MVHAVAKRPACALAPSAPALNAVGSSHRVPPHQLSSAWSGSSSAETPPQPEIAARAVDTTPQRILLFGDSMVPVLVPRLADYCLENGHQLFPATWYGSTIIYWAWQDKLDKLLVEHKPTMVIAVLGSSELTVRDVSECGPFIQLIARKVAPRKFLWIGPPNWRADTGVNALIEASLGSDQFFRSADLQLLRRSDAIHPSEAAGQIWVDAFVRWTTEKSSFPIVMAPPTRKAPSVATQVFSRPVRDRR